MAYRPPCALDTAAPAAPPPAPATGQAALAVKVEQLGRERRIGGGWLLRVGGQMGVCLGSSRFTSWRLKRLCYDRSTRKTIMRILDTGRFRRIVCTAFDKHGDVGTENR